MKPNQYQKPLPRNGNNHIDLNKATGTGISFASGGALIGAELAGLIGGLIFAVILGLIGFAIVALIRNAR
jgi:predicted lipid-binding transport protein (Tim44 family)